MDTHCNTDGPQSMMLTKTGQTKGWIVCDYADEKCPEQAIHRNREWLVVVRGY